MPMKTKSNESLQDELKACKDMLKRIQFWSHSHHGDKGASGIRTEGLKLKKVRSLKDLSHNELGQTSIKSDVNFI